MCRFIFDFCKKFIKPYNEGFLPALDGHSLYYQQVGNPKGTPVIMFHGGPAGSAKPKYASIFDLKKYRVIMFDQRGCGKSKYDDALYKNTTLETVKDALRLLEFLQVESKVVVSGGSFGATCAILFAQTYPHKTASLIVNSVFLARRQDIENMSPIMPYFYPDALDILHQKAGKSKLSDYYYKRIFSKKRSDNDEAINYYKAVDKQMGELAMTFKPQEVSVVDIRKFRIFMQYLKDDYYLKDNQLIKNARKLANIPVRIYQNRFDFCCPPYQAFELHKAIKHSELIMVEDMGHGGDKMFYTMYQDSRRYA